MPMRQLDIMRPQGARYSPLPRYGAVPSAPRGAMLFFLPHFSRKTELTITTTEPALWTNAPATGFNIPPTASMMAMKFRAMENVRLHLIVRIMRLAEGSRVISIERTEREQGEDEAEETEAEEAPEVIDEE